MTVFLEDVRALLRSNTVRALILAALVSLMPATGEGLVDQVVGALDLVLVLAALFFRTRARGPIELRPAQWFGGRSRRPTDWR